MPDKIVSTTQSQFMQIICSLAQVKRRHGGFHQLLAIKRRFLNDKDVCILDR